MNRLVREFRNNDDGKTSYGILIGSGFFAPYKSLGDFGAELFTPVVSPIIAAFCVLQAALHTVNALSHLVMISPGEEQKKDGWRFGYDPGVSRRSAQKGLGFLIVAIGAILLPFLGAISIITRLGGTVYNAVTSDDEADSACLSCTV